jgi:hypothetical protein
VTSTAAAADAALGAVDAAIDKAAEAGDARRAERAAKEEAKRAAEAAKEAAEKAEREAKEAEAARRREEARQAAYAKLVAQLSQPFDFETKPGESNMLFSDRVKKPGLVDDVAKWLGAFERGETGQLLTTASAGSARKKGLLDGVWGFFNPTFATPFKTIHRVYVAGRPIPAGTEAFFATFHEQLARRRPVRSSVHYQVDREVVEPKEVEAREVGAESDDEDETIKEVKTTFVTKVVTKPADWASLGETRVKCHECMERGGTCCVEPKQRFLGACATDGIRWQFHLDQAYDVDEVVDVTRERRLFGFLEQLAPGYRWVLRPEPRPSWGKPMPKLPHREPRKWPAVAVAKSKPDAYLGANTFDAKDLRAELKIEPKLVRSGVDLDLRTKAFSAVEGPVETVFGNVVWLSCDVNEAGETLSSRRVVMDDVQLSTIMHIYRPGYSVGREEMERLAGELRRFPYANATGTVKNVVLDGGLFMTAVWLAELAKKGELLRNWSFQSGPVVAGTTDQ